MATIVGWAAISCEREQLPVLGQALENLHILFAEAILGARNQFSDGIGHQDFPGSSGIGYARRGVHGNADNPTTGHFTLP